ncbi:MAG: glycosyltransferase [Cyanobacteria bacterium P01_A01_bin.114]
MNLDSPSLSSPSPFSPLTFSIVIPTYNRPRQLAACLESLKALDYPRDRFEVVVVDDGSETDLSSVVAPVSDDLDIRLIKQPNAGPGAARNHGVSCAKGDYIAFTDDDCIPHPDWLSNIASHLQKTPDGLVGGHTLNALSHNPYSAASQQLIDYLYSYFHDRHPQKSIRFFTSNNMGMAKQTFLTVGGFDTKLRIASEDRELCDRWLQRGYPMVYAPEVKISHAHDLSLRSFWKQHFSYGRGAFYFHTARASRAESKIKVEPLSFYLGLLTYPIRQRLGIFQIVLSGLFLVSQVAMTVGFFWEKSRQSVAPTEAATP